MQFRRFCSILSEIELKFKTMRLNVMWLSHVIQQPRAISRSFIILTSSYLPQRHHSIKNVFLKLQFTLQKLKSFVGLAFLGLWILPLLEISLTSFLDATNSAHLPKPQPTAVTASRINMSPCKFFLQGHCMYGKRCRGKHDVSPVVETASHEGSPLVARDPQHPRRIVPIQINTTISGLRKENERPLKPSIQPCKFFPLGTCMWGSGCRNSHGSLDHYKRTFGWRVYKNHSWSECHLHGRSWNIEI